MAEEVFMEIPVLRGYVKQFKAFSQILDAVSKALDAIVQALRSVAFIGGVSAAVAQFIDMINKQYIKPLAKNCSTMSRELGKSIDAYERGDAQGATLFF